MSPQVLSEGNYSSKSDVWSFGVCLWECCMYAMDPYPGLTDEAVVEQVQKGQRMKQPHGVPDDIYQVMQRCWHMSPRSRPDFEDLLSALQGLCRCVELHSKMWLTLFSLLSYQTSVPPTSALSTS